VLFAVIAAFVLPAMTTVRTGRASTSQPMETWIVAVLLFIVCGVCIVLAWRRGLRSDRIAALLTLALTGWLVYGFINAVT
jgi:CHASE2 domain-containing sensor protein